MVYRLNNDTLKKKIFIRINIITYMFKGDMTRADLIFLALSLKQ